MAEDHEMLLEDGEEQRQHGEEQSAALTSRRLPLAPPQTTLPRGPVFLKKIAISGFKSFRIKAKIGPLSSFSCIVGPNGAGKSVIGEALAFVLGSSAKTMRAKCLSALLNEEMRNSEAKSFAKVSVTLEGSNSHRVKVSRVTNGSSSSDVWSLDGRKRQLSFLEARQELLDFGIAADISERFIVMQSRQAVKAKQPLDLCEYLEIVFGAGQFKGMILETEKEISEKSNEIIMMQEKLTEVQSKIERLWPEVEKWRSFDNQWHDFQSRKVSYLHFQENALRCQLQENSVEMGNMHSTYHKIKEEKDTIQDLQKKILLQISDLKALLQQKKRVLGALEKRFLDLRVRMVKAQVRFTAAKKDVENTRQEHLEMQQRQDVLKNTLEALSSKIEQLKDKRKSLSQQKEVLREKKPVISAQKLLLNTEDKECSKFVGEEREDESFEKISKFQKALVTIEKDIEGSQVQASKLSAEVHLIEKQCIEMIEERNKRDLERLAAEEALNAALVESNNVSSCVLPDLKENLKEIEVEIFNLKKKIHSCEKRVSRNSTEDKAVELLMKKLRGKFYGRAVDLAKVKGNMIQAVNSVITHLMNTSKTFVTADRKTANDVISHFQNHKIGVATCEILSELRELYQNASIVLNGFLGQHIMEYIECEEIFKPVFWKYTKNWIIVEDLHAALSVLARKKSMTVHKNIVTSKGDIFKQDGEVISAAKNLSGVHLLQSDHQIESRHEVSPTLVRDYERRVNYLCERQTILKGEIFSNENRLTALQIQVRELETRLQNLQAGANIDSFNSLSSRVTEKRKCLSKLQRNIQTLQLEASDLQKVILHLEDLRNKMFSPELTDWRKKIESIDEEMKNYDLEIQQKKSSVKSLLNKLKRAENLATEVGSRELLLAEAELQYLQAKEDLDNESIQKDKMASELENISQRLAELGQEADKYKKKIIKLQKKETELQTQLDKLCQSESQLQDKLHKVLKALPEYSEEVPSKRLLQDFNNFPHVNHLEREDKVGEGIALAEEELSLKEIHETINPCTLDEDLFHRKEEIELIEKVDALDKVLISLKRRKETLENERYIIFTRSVREVNNHLSNIYGRFTKHGDAYLSFTEEKILLYMEGVNFQVRPGRHRWCNFSSLSGGQQALAALALSFSLQLQFPSPFYFFDEIDAALDTKNTQLVADYVKKQNYTQYIIVSHRPQLYEHASTIAGIYHCCGSSRSITAQV